MEQHGNTSFQNMVRDICPYYYDLVDIMADRAGIQPKVTSYDDLTLDENSPSDKDVDNFILHDKNSSADSEDNGIIDFDDGSSKEDSGPSISPCSKVVPNATPNKALISVKTSLAKRKERKNSKTQVESTRQ